MVAAILEGGRVTIDVAPLNAEELAILRPIIEGATGKFAWSAIEMRQMLATIDAAYEERDRLREIEKVARDWIEAGDQFVAAAIADRAPSARKLLHVKDNMRRALATYDNATSVALEGRE